MRYTAAVKVILQRRPAGEVIHCSSKGPFPPARTLIFSTRGNAGTLSTMFPATSQDPEFAG
jgi:hypothetical protein